MKRCHQMAIALPCPIKVHAARTVLSINAFGRLSLEKLLLDLNWCWSLWGLAEVPPLRVLEDLSSVHISNRQDEGWMYHPHTPTSMFTVHQRLRRESFHPIPPLSSLPLLPALPCTRIPTLYNIFQITYCALFNVHQHLVRRINMISMTPLSRCRRVAHAYSDPTSRQDAVGAT